MTIKYKKKKTLLIVGIIFISTISVIILNSNARNYVFRAFAYFNVLNDSSNTEKKNSISILNAAVLNPKQNLSSDFTYKIISTDSSITANPFITFTDDFAGDSVSIFFFRGNYHRNAPTRGEIAFQPKSLQLVWEFLTDYDTVKTDYGTWGGGSGWTGQPLFINWNKEQKIKLGIKDTAFIENKNAMEMIIGSLCGNIYFIDPSTGKKTRPPLSIQNPIKGTVSVDPRKNGLLYVGQGIQRSKGKFGAHVFNMFTGKEIFYLPGYDHHAYRQWGAFDSNPIIDYKTGAIFWPAENGLIYKFYIDEKLNIKNLTKLKYSTKKFSRPGIESSIAVLRNLGFVADNSGTLLCIDLRTMKPIWNISNFDDTDATILIDTDNNKDYFLYTGNEVDHQGAKGTSSFRKIDALTGKEIWRVDQICYGTALGGKPNSGGMLASPLSGKNKGKNLIFCIYARVDKQGRSLLYAINKQTGKIVYTFKLDNYSWASPVDIYDNKGNLYLFFTDVGGTLYLMDGLTGKLIFKENIDRTIEASPVVVNDKIYFASRGKTILCYQLK